jgi:2-oxoisovalerate dehydrogenase E1 component
LFGQWYLCIENPTAMANTADTPAMTFERRQLTNDQLRELYVAITKPRRIEEKMLILLRQGKVSKWFSGIGQEGISVGVTQALEPDEYILPLHRNLGVFTGRNMPLGRLFAQWQGKMSGFSKGRERSFHFGSNEHHIVGMISHLGPQLCVADGIALSSVLQNKHKVAVAFTGDGGTSEGDFHEALNLAAVWSLPVIFIIENNGYGLSTPTNEQFKAETLVSRAQGYGMKGKRIDGNNLLEVYHTINEIAQDIRETPEPWLIECMTFRMRGHEEASGVKYVPKELFELWQVKDPVDNYQNWLLAEGVIDEEFVATTRKAHDAEIEEGLKLAFDEPEVTPNTESELHDVYAPYTTPPVAPGEAKREMRLVDAVSDGLREGMRHHHNLVIMGQDVAEYGGVFKVTDGFVEEFGKHRVRNTPICESVILSAGLGMSVGGMKSVIEMQFADFVTSGFNAVVNNLAKSYWRWGQNADVVVRMPSGAGVGAGPFHSQSNESWFAHAPGLKVVFPSNPYDAKGLLLASIDDPNPVMFFEHKALYRSLTGEVPEGYYTVPLGKANIVREGEDLSIITYGMGVHWALDALKEFPDINAEILDLRTLLPLDYDAIRATVNKTGKAIVLYEDTLTAGIGTEVAAWISEHCFTHLDAPVMREASLDTPVPFAAALEQNFLPKERFKVKLKELAEY